MLGSHLCTYFCVPHVNESAVRAGSAANAAETVKRTKYRYRTIFDQFEAVAFETAGTYSNGTKNIIRDIGRRLTEAIGDQRGTFWFMLNPTHSSVNEFPLPGVTHLSMDSFNVI